MMRWFSLLVLVLSLQSLTSATAHAQPGADACEKDVQSLCSGVEPGEGRIAQCLKDNKDKISEACKAKWHGVKETMKEVKEACHADFEKHCTDSKGPKGAMKCLRKHKKELSAECQKEMKELKEKRKHKHK